MRYTQKTKAVVMPDLVDRFPTTGNPPDGYVITYSSSDGYFIPKATSKVLVFSSPTVSPYTVVAEDVVLVQSHSGIFTVTLPTAPTSGTTIVVKDFAGVATANPISVASVALVDGSASYSISANYGSVKVMYNGTTWSILSKY